MTSISVRMVIEKVFNKKKQKNNINQTFNSCSWVLMYCHCAKNVRSFICTINFLQTTYDVVLICLSCLVIGLHKASNGSGGRAGAPYTEAVSSLQRPRVQFPLWSFAACHSPSLSPVSCLPFSCTGGDTYVQRRERKTEEKSVALWQSLTLCFRSDIIMFHAQKTRYGWFFRCCMVKMTSARAFFCDKLRYIANKLFLLLTLFLYFPRWQLVWLLPSNSD